jgi:hypothetical protein
MRQVPDSDKQDLRSYSDDELSLLVFNDEGLYRMRRRSDFIETLNELYIFTADQLETLQADLSEDEVES